MAVNTYEVLQVGNPFLHKPVAEMEVVDEVVLKPIVQNMIKICLENNGMGLSANQIGLSLRMFVMQDTVTGTWETYINPKILESGGRSREKEGCLSFAKPKKKFWVRRKFWVNLEYTNLKGEKVTGRFEEYTARCVQHEIDHLDGITMNLKGQKA